MRKALVVGINYYKNGDTLNGANDALSMSEILRINGDGQANFQVKKLLAKGQKTAISRKTLKTEIKKLFESEAEVALFYFAGHGHTEKNGGYLVTSDCDDYEDGVSMRELVDYANSSLSKNKIIILDCCHSGIVGSIAGNESFSVLSDGVTIIAASGPNEASNEINKSGVFTTLFVEGMKGGAADYKGEITPAGIYAFVERAFGHWIQKPVFKSNNTGFVSLRKTTPILPPDLLKEIVSYFQEPDFVFPLDPSYEYTNSPEIKIELIQPYATSENEAKFKVLQKLQSLGFIEPVDAPFLYFAAMESKSCRLTPLGRHYWRLVKEMRV